MILYLLLAFVSFTIESLETNEAVDSSKSFSYLEYGEMITFMQELQEKYPDIVRLFVAQDKYNLPFPTELKCPKSSKKPNRDLLPCKQYVLHVTNHSKNENIDRPEIFISGALHGDERVGPLASIELVALLAEGANSHALHPSKARRNVNDLVTRQWLHSLVNTRNIYVMPMTNAYGFAHHVREERENDPNRDFNIMKAPNCMESMTARVINELWRDHVFELAITFHGGTQSISYEWGSPDHFKGGRSQKSPDHTGLVSLAETLALYGGSFQDGSLYKTGTMNDVVYGVTGGMEDWSYAASWENQVLKASGQSIPFAPCRPTSYGGYLEEKTIYNNVTHRTVMMLIETSDDKEPLSDTLGDYADLYDTNLDYYYHEDAFNPVEHVTRNVKVALMLIEMARPYIRWLAFPSMSHSTGTSKQVSSFISLETFVTEKKFSREDIRIDSCPASENTDIIQCGACDCRANYSSPSKDVQLLLAWEVLGAFTVDETYLELSLTSDFEKVLERTKRQTGITRRALRSKSMRSKVPFFTECVHLSKPANVSVGIYFIRAVAMVDQDWSVQGSKANSPSPLVPPQTHTVNVRTNAAWNMKSNGHRVRGSLWWYSSIISLRFEHPSSTFSNPPSIRTEAENKTSPISSPLIVKGNSKLKRDNHILQLGFVVLATGILVVLLTSIYVYRRLFRSPVKKQQYARLNVRMGHSDEVRNMDDLEKHGSNNESAKPQLTTKRHRECVIDTEQ
uniref:Uncharacterized protein AlNc14C7G969 n=1 Tax=Albugo laibachii Nc14 TaxID=890382 RepID=F0W1K2_9STRA|nr:conserved hypothetical protein [Albugo laibachii Nc14]|eukprot:CCA14931.1 conserved hypothetical protein [Albugo laibachii Nc14]